MAESDSSKVDNKRATPPESVGPAISEILLPGTSVLLRIDLTKLRKTLRPIAIDLLIIAAGITAIWVALYISFPPLQIIACIVAVTAFGYIVVFYRIGLWTMKIPAIVAVFYAILITGDQSIETLRVIVNDYSAGIAILGFTGLFFLLLYLQVALVMLCLLSLGEGSRNRVSREQAVVMLLIVATPTLATTFAIYAVTNWWPLWALYSVLFCLVLAAWPTGVFARRDTDAVKSELLPEEIDIVGMVDSSGAFDSAKLRQVLPALIVISVFTIFLPKMSTWIFGSWELYSAVFLTAITVFVTALIALPKRNPGSGYAAVIFVFLIGFGGLLSYLRLNDNHVIAARAMPLDRARNFVPVDVAFDKWLMARQVAPEKPATAIIVAAEGGGLRAAYTTALVLEAMRRGCPAFREDHFATIGVSGGSVGAALSAAAPKNESVSHLGCEIERYDQDNQPLAAQVSGTDLLRPLLRGMLLVDLPTQVLPTVFHKSSSTMPANFTAGLTTDRDRTRFMAAMLDRTWAAAGGTPKLDNIAFSDVWTPGQVGKPALILLTTDATSGRRLAMSHLRFGALRAPSLDRCLEPWEVENAGDELRSRLLTFADVAPSRDFRLVDGAFASARFPGTSPSGILPCPGQRWQVVDGGYFENSGLTTAEDMVDLIANMSSGPRRDVTIVVLAIANGRAPTNDDNTMAHRRDPTQSTRGPYFSEALGPLSTFYGTRNARGEIARASLLARDGHRFGCVTTKDGPVGLCVTLRFVVVELDQCNVPIPLGWSLSKGALTEIRQQLGLAREKIEDPCVVAIAKANRAAMEEVIRLANRDNQ